MSEGVERSIIDRDTVADLPDHDPNVACGVGDFDHENHIGDPVADFQGITAGRDDLDPDGPR